MKTTFKHTEKIQAKRFYNSLQGDKTFKTLPNCKGFIVEHQDQWLFFEDNVACLNFILGGV